MRTAKIDEIQEDEVNVVVTEKAPDKIIGKAGRKAKSEKDKAKHNVTLWFTDEELIKIEMMMKLEGFDKNSKYARAGIIKKMMSRDMYRNGIEF